MSLEEGDFSEAWREEALDQMMPFRYLLETR